MTITEFISQANAYGYSKTPFFFLLDFELKKPFICCLDMAHEKAIRYDVRGEKNFSSNAQAADQNFTIEHIPVSKSQYTNAFILVKDNLQKGNSYLVNLTFPTKLRTDLELDQIFQKSIAPYKLNFQDNFVVFSPECFIKTAKNFIYSYPMKGTIDASIPDAEQIILEDKKETWEHNTIVDLIRNDLAMVAYDITVTKFRYIDKIRTDRNELLQVSSEIRGELDPDWQSGIGDILIRMLPAGSISGAPKKKTIEIITEAEMLPRGYYTGIFGIFDGINIDSAVNIRYIEKTGSNLQYRSGGGITAMSDLDSEYQEMLDKVYVPID